MSTKLYILLLLALCVVIFFRWLSFDIFSSGDWIYFYPISLRDAFSHFTWATYAGVGFVDLVAWRAPVDILIATFGKLGFGSNVSDKFLIFWPSVIIATTSSFFLFRRVLRSNFAGFIGAIIFNYNTYHFTASSAFLLYAAEAWSVLTLLIFMIALERSRLYLFLLAALTLFITGAYDFRIVYISVLVLGVYFAFYNIVITKFQQKTFFRNLFFFAIQGMVFVLLNIYWLLPSIFSSSLTTNAVLDRTLFGNEFLNVLYAFSFFHPFWTGGEAAYFEPQKIFLWFWIIPFFAFAGLWLSRRNKYVLFFGLIALIGIFLTKQVAMPFTGVYSWLFENFPGFNAFREASKFYFLIALGYAVLIGAFVDHMLKRSFNKKWEKHLKRSTVAIIVFIFLFNTLLIITGKIGSIYIARYIPQDYNALNSFLTKDTIYYRVLWVPYSSSWSLYSNTKPVVNFAGMQQEMWNFLIKEKISISKPQAEAMMLLLKQDEAPQLLDISSVRYLIVPLEDRENKMNFFTFYGRSRSYYIEEMDQLEYLKKIDVGTNKIDVYENMDFKPHIYITTEEETIKERIAYREVDYTFINPTEYTLGVKNVTGPFYINFSEAFHQGWKLRVGPLNRMEAFEESYFLPEKNHFRNDAGLNSYYVNPQQICTNNTQGCSNNEDGSYDIEFSLYYKPQSYFDMGRVISIATLITVALYCTWALVNNRRNNTNEKAK